MNYNKTPTIKQYIKDKKEILSDMNIELSAGEMKHLESLDNCSDIDRYVHDFIFRSDEK